MPCSARRVRPALRTDASAVAVPPLSTRPTCEAAGNHWVAGLPACCILPCAGPGSARGRRVLLRLLLSLLRNAACNGHILPLLSLMRHAAVSTVSTGASAEAGGVAGELLLCCLLLAVLLLLVSSCCATFPLRRGAGAASRWIQHWTCHTGQG